MSRLTSYKNLHKAFQRLRLLYEVTIHSYNGLYDDGRKLLRSKENANSKVNIEIGGAVKARPLKVITHHAKDVYPWLLRSTLLVRMVAVYEAFLIDAIYEVGERDLNPFMNSKRLDLSQEQLISLHQKKELIPFIIDKATRQLTSGGLKDIRKFYKSAFGIDIIAPEQSLKDIEEIHDRRHLHVHRGGYSDDQFAHKYSEQGFASGDQLAVGEQYFLAALASLETSALHIKQSLEKSYPTPLHLMKHYKSGSLQLPDHPPSLQYVSFQILDKAAISKYYKFEVNLNNGTDIKNLVLWTCRDNNSIRMIIGGSENEVQRFRQELYLDSKEGKIGEIESFKVKRKKTPNEQRRADSR